MASRRGGSHRSARQQAIKLLLPALGVAVLSLATSSASATGCPAADLQPAAANVDQIRSAVLCLHNADRAERGLSALRESRRLRRAALEHSSDMVREGYFAHTSPDRESFVDRILRSGYASWHAEWTLGENLAWGTGQLSTARGVEEAWMRSSGHKGNILRSA
jgi:uncharacterized protein YkwD